MMTQPTIPRPSIRLYVDTPLQAGALAELSAAQSHYLTHVMRRHKGEDVALFNGRDGEWAATIVATEKRAGIASVHTRLRGQYASPDIWLLFAPIKHGAIDFLVEKATELGVSALSPVMTQHTTVTRINTERMRAHVIEASEQCGRMDIPRVQEAVSLAKILEEWPQERMLIYCDETGHGQPANTLLRGMPQGKLAIIIGPEGGFSKGEHQCLRQLPYVRAMGMGPRILRAETAALAALTCVQAWLGDWEHSPAFVAT